MINNTFIKYSVIGVFNTFVGYGIIFVLVYFGLFPELSNFIGYFIGFFVSYFLNKKYNFKSKNHHKEDFPRFLLSMSIAYLSNLLVLVICYRFLDINVYLSQVFAGVVYVLVGYSLSKIWVFKKGVDSFELLD